jgi:hypothetical protein
MKGNVILIRTLEIMKETKTSKKSEAIFRMLENIQSKQMSHS